MQEVRVLEQWHYLYSGLRVASHLPLPEWAPFEAARPFAEAQVRFVLHHALIDSQPVEENLPSGNLPRIEPQQYCFRVPDIGHYRVRDGSEIAVTPRPGAGMREVRLFLLGSAWGALCYQRGLLPMHASVVQVADGAVAFCGATGAGKSSTAAWLAERGYPLLSDDLCTCELPVQGQPAIWPSATRLKLWSDTLGAFDWGSEGLERDHFRTDKFHLPWTGPGRRAVQPVPLRAIYLLAWDETGLTRLRGMTALRRVVAEATYRGELLEPMGEMAAHWERWAQVVRRVPVWEFRRPRDWAALDAAMTMLTSRWSPHE